MARVKKYRLPATGEQEYVCQCPRCLTVETLWFRGDTLVPTVKFSQGEDGRVYHNCNQCSSGLCRLFPKWEAGKGSGKEHNEELTALGGCLYDISRRVE